MLKILETRIDALLGITVAAAVLLAGGVTRAAAEVTLTPHTAEYRVKISVLGGRLRTHLETTPDGYIATHDIQATGMSRLLAGGRISETSEFSHTADGIRPVQFRSDDTLTREKTRAQIAFDWDTEQASGTVNDEDVLYALDTLAYDRVSIQYELMLDMLNGGPSEHYLLFDIDELKTVFVENIGTKTVKVPAGEFEAVGLRHQTEGSKRSTTMWCVPELDYLPVIIQQHRKGKLRMSAELSRYSPQTGSLPSAE